ncbi:proteasome assembly chaperone 2-like [Mercenaria mercenaria]|uniref:proteasome assembly chaperone 2-like n=1 Tax=Mercenaria mercenaria TaxID=6596 RepID=UPI00234F35DC|nr:proteasome assembly chaperone 2-like [Mercenaria mercenaria]
MDYNGIRLQTDTDGIAVVIMCNGDNKFTMDFVRTWHQVLDDIEKNEDITGLITIGEGRAFSTGLDINWLKTQSPTTLDEYHDELHKLYKRLMSLGLTTVAVINGFICRNLSYLHSRISDIEMMHCILQGKRGLFRKWLVQWIKENQFSRVVIATSSSAEERLDTQLQGPQFRFVASPQIEKMFGDMFRNFYEWEELEKRQSFPAPSMLEAGEDQGGELYIPGGGVAKTLFEDLYEDVPTAICLMFCAEGDNVVEAVELANRLNRWLGLILFHSRSIGGADEEAVVKYTKWKIPVSWKLFYGSKFDQTLYH